MCAACGAQSPTAPRVSGAHWHCTGTTRAQPSWVVLSRDGVRELRVCSAGALAHVRRGLPALRDVRKLCDPGRRLRERRRRARARPRRCPPLHRLAALRALHLDTSGVVLAGTAQADSLTVLLQQCPLLERLDVRLSETETPSVFTVAMVPGHALQPAHLPHLHTLELHGAAAFAPFVLTLHIPALRALVLAPPAHRACLAALLRLGAAGTAVRRLALDLAPESVQRATRADTLLRTLRAMPHLAALGTSADGYIHKLVEGLAHGLSQLSELAFSKCSALDGALLVALVRARLSGETRIHKIALHACPLVDAESRAALAQLVPDFVCSD